MADIFHDFIIKAPATKVFEAMTTSGGLDKWWTKKSAGTPAEGAEYILGFGPGYDWKAKVGKFVPGKEFELLMTASDPDWEGTRSWFSSRGEEGHLADPVLPPGLAHAKRALPCIDLLLGHVSAGAQTIP